MSIFTVISFMDPQNHEIVHPWVHSLCCRTICGPTVHCCLVAWVPTTSCTAPTSCPRAFLSLIKMMVASLPLLTASSRSCSACKQHRTHPMTSTDRPAVDFLLLFASQSQIQRAHPRSHASQHTPDDISRRDCSKLPAAVCAYQIEQAVKLRTLPGACHSHHRLLTACCLVMQQHSHADRLVMRPSKWNGGWHAGWKLPAVAGSLPALCPGRLASEACAVNEPDELPLLLPCAGQTPPA